MAREVPSPAPIAPDEEVASLEHDDQQPNTWLGPKNSAVLAEGGPSLKRKRVICLSFAPRPTLDTKWLV
jgi:hypothetical protein